MIDPDPGQVPYKYPNGHKKEILQLWIVMSSQFCTLAISTLCPSDTFGGTKIFKWENSISVHPSPSSEIVLPGNPPVRSSEVKSGSGPEVIEAGPGYSRPSDPRTRPTKGPTWKLQNCSRSRSSRWWWARTQVKWGRIIGAMFVYCEETGEGSWSTKNMGLHWLFFMAIADDLNVAKEETTLCLL